MKLLHPQMSESVLVGILLSLSGGFQDAYTYLCRGKTYANAQTGNVILMSMSLADGEWEKALYYLIPLVAFVGGLLLAQLARRRMRTWKALHWRQLVLGAEIVLLLVSGALPAALDHLASALVSFACALQVDSFRTVERIPYASTMCIGNLRSAADSFAAYWDTKDPSHRGRGLMYLFFILIFAVGAVAGGLCSRAVGRGAVWVCCLLLLCALLLMFRKEREA